MRALVVHADRDDSGSRGHFRVTAVRGRGERVRGLRFDATQVGLHVRGDSVLLLLTSRVSGLFE